MASSGIRRKVDDLGRVVIPAGIRRTLGIREGDPVEVTVEGERVVLAKPHDACVFCGREEEEPTDFRGRLVCRDCLASLGAVDERRRATTDATAREASPAPRRAADLPAWDAPTRPPAPPSSPTTAAPRPAPSVTRPAEPSRGHAPSEHRPAAARDARPEVRPDRPEPRTGTSREEPGAEDATPDGTRPGRRPPYDPASTTAW